MIRLAICVPTAGMVHACTNYSTVSLLAYLTGGLKSRPNETLEISYLQQVSSVIHANRETLVNQALQKECTHLLFIDDDMYFEPNAVDILLGRRHPIVVVNYCFKKYPIDFLAVSLDGTRRIPTKEDSTGLEEISYSGFGLSLFEIEVFKKVPKPWFLPEYVPELDVYTTEDNPFYRRAREAGFKVYLDHDASKLVEHEGTMKFAWSQRENKAINNAN